MDLVTSTGALPVPAGGTIANGTYVITSFKQFTAQVPDGTKLFTLGKTTLEVNGMTVQTVVTDKNGVESRATDTMTTSALTLTTTQTCQFPKVDAGSAAKSAEYTATATSFTFINTTAQGTIETVFTKL